MVPISIAWYKESWTISWYKESWTKQERICTNYRKFMWWHCHRRNDWTTWMVYPYIAEYSFISASSENRAEHNLLQNLLRDYNTNVRPVRHPSESVEVAIGVAMKQIVDLVSSGNWTALIVKIRLHCWYIKTVRRLTTRSWARLRLVRVCGCQYRRKESLS